MTNTEPKNITDEPWTEWSKYCQQEGFITNEVDSDDPVVQLLSPLYEQIKNLAAEEAQIAQDARLNGRKYTLDWTQVFVNLQTRMATEEKERSANVDQQFRFGTWFAQLRTYVEIDGQRYDINQLEELLESLDNSDIVGTAIVVPQHMQELIKRYDLATQRADGGWACRNHNARHFCDRLIEAHDQYLNNKR